MLNALRKISDSTVALVPRAAARRLLTIALTAFATILAPPSSAQDGYPNAPIKMIVPFAPGGFVDTLARMMAPAMTVRLGQPLVIENRGGAGGILGTTAVAQATPNGYTVLFAIDTHASNQNLYKNLPYDAVKDFSPVAYIGSSPMVLIANLNLPANDVPTLVKMLKDKPDSVTYASVGTGSQVHLAMKLLESSAGVHMVHVPYKGGGPAFNDLMGGHVQTMFASVTSATPLLQGKRVKGLAVAAPARVPTLPNIPTMAEQGYPAVEMLVWLGVLAPAGTPQAVINKMRDTIRETIAQPDVAKRMAEMGVQPDFKGPADFAAYLKKEIEWRGNLIRKENISASSE